MIGAGWVAGEGAFTMGLARATRDGAGATSVKLAMITVPAAKPAASRAKSRPEGPPAGRNMRRRFMIGRLLADPIL